MADGAPRSAEGPERQKEEGSAEPFVCAVCGPTSCSFPLAWGRERFQPVHSSKVCRDCSDSEEGGPGTHSIGNQSF